MVSTAAVHRIEVGVSFLVAAVDVVIIAVLCSGIYATKSSASIHRPKYKIPWEVDFPCSFSQRD
jgi:hypothetical protein